MKTPIFILIILVIILFIPFPYLISCQCPADNPNCSGCSVPANSYKVGGNGYLYFKSSLAQEIINFATGRK